MAKVIRTIKVQTEELRDAALRYERLALSLGDTAEALDMLYADLNVMVAREDILRKASALCRKADGLVYRTQDLGGRLHFAASCYEGYALRVRRLAEEVLGNEVE